MDRTSVSGTVDVGSIPAGGTSVFCDFDICGLHSIIVVVSYFELRASNFEFAKAGGVA